MHFKKPYTFNTFHSRLVCLHNFDMEDKIVPSLDISPNFGEAPLWNRQAEDGLILVRQRPWLKGGLVHKLPGLRQESLFFPKIDFFPLVYILVLKDSTTHQGT